MKTTFTLCFYLSEINEKEKWYLQYELPTYDFIYLG